MSLGMPNTATELRIKRERQGEAASKAVVQQQAPPAPVAKVVEAPKKKEEELKAPWELLEALFNEEDEPEEEKDVADEEENETDETTASTAMDSTQRIEQRMIESVAAVSASASSQVIKSKEVVGRVITVEDLVEDDGMFGPALPPSMNGGGGNNGGQVVARAARPTPGPIVKIEPTRAVTVHTGRSNALNACHLYCNYPLSSN